MRQASPSRMMMVCSGSFSAVNFHDFIFTYSRKPMFLYMFGRCTLSPVVVLLFHPSSVQYFVDQYINVYPEPLFVYYV